jgi:hypothetical protein
VLLVPIHNNSDDLRAGHAPTMLATKAVVEPTACYLPSLR